MEKMSDIIPWLRKLETTYFGRTIEVLTQTESTNSVAMALGLNNAPAGTLIIADTQSKGRGRLGKSWYSEAGTGLYFSLVLRPSLPLVDLPKITLAAGVGVCQAIEEQTNLFPGLKWPNDLLLAGRKFGGILTETGPCRSARPLVILGIGINVLTPQAAFPENLQQKATSLLTHSSKEVCRGKLLSSILVRLEKIFTLLEQGGFQEILAAWKVRDAYRDANITCLTPEGRVISGISLGPDEHGVLHIRDDEGKIHEVFSGDISL